eukprot:Rhum_TRINITY_DN15430_c4_g3::Rhum_TRINITY_DN15430_c4_g3_i2::g.158318::m.158318
MMGKQNTIQSSDGQVLSSQTAKFSDGRVFGGGRLGRGVVGRLVGRLVRLVVGRGSLAVDVLRGLRLVTLRLLGAHHDSHNHTDDEEHADSDTDAQTGLLRSRETAVVVRRDHNRGRRRARRRRVGHRGDHDAVGADHRVRGLAVERDALRVVAGGARRERLRARQRRAHSRARGHGVAESGVRVREHVGAARAAGGGGGSGGQRHRRRGGSLAHRPLGNKLRHEHGRAAAGKVHSQRLVHVRHSEEVHASARAPVRHLRSVVTQHFADQRREALNLRLRRRARQAGVVRDRVAELDRRRSRRHAQADVVASGVVVVRTRAAAPVAQADVLRARGVHVAEGGARGVVRAPVLVAASGRLPQLRLELGEVQDALVLHARRDVRPPRAVRVHDAVVELVGGDSGAGTGAGDVLRADARVLVLVVSHVALLHEARAGNRQALRNVLHDAAGGSRAHGLDGTTQLVLDGGGLAGQRGVEGGRVGLEDSTLHQLDLEAHRDLAGNAQELRGQHLTARERRVHSHDRVPHVLRDRVRAGRRLADVGGLRRLLEDEDHIVRLLLLVAARVLPLERVLALEVVVDAVGARALVRLGVAGGAGVAVLPAVGVLHARHKRVRQRRADRVHVARHTRQVAAQLVVAPGRNAPRRPASAARNRRRLPLQLERRGADGVAHLGVVRVRARLLAAGVHAGVRSPSARNRVEVGLLHVTGNALRLARGLAALLLGAGIAGAHDSGEVHLLARARVARHGGVVRLARSARFLAALGVAVVLVSARRRVEVGNRALTRRARDGHRLARPLAALRLGAAGLVGARVSGKGRLRALARVARHGGVARGARRARLRAAIGVAAGLVGAHRLVEVGNRALTRRARDGHRLARP